MSTMTPLRRIVLPLLLAAALPAGAAGQVTFERLLNADAEPHNLSLIHI